MSWVSSELISRVRGSLHFVFATILIGGWGGIFSAPLEAQTFVQAGSLSFTKGFGGADPLPQTVTITTAGTAFNFSSTATTNTGGSWLSVSDASFNGCGLCLTPHNLQAVVKADLTLAAGTYTGQIVLKSQNLVATMTINVTLIVAPASSAFLDNLPGQMSFSLKTSGLTPPHQSFHIRNGGTGTLTWTLATSTSVGGSWLSPSLTAGTAPSTVDVSLLKASLPGGGITQGTFLGRITISGGGTSTTIPVSVVVGDNVFEQVNAISFTKPFGGANPLPQTLTGASTGATFQFTASAATSNGGNWLSVINTSFNDCALCLTPESVHAVVNASPTLAVGSYTGQILFTSRDGSQNITIPVNLTVTPLDVPFFDNLAGGMNFSLVTSGFAPPAQPVDIRNGGTSGTLSWSVSGSTADGGNWLTISPGLNGIAPSTIEASISVASLPNGGLIPGTFVGQLLFHSSNGDVTIPISVTVGDAVFRQVNAISFAKAFGGADPLPQTLTAASTGAAFQFTASASTATGGAWLTIDNQSFNDCALCLTPQALRVSAHPSPALAAGSYTGQVVFTSRDGTLTLTIPVTLNIADPATPFFDDLPGQLTFSLATGGDAPPSQSIQIRNRGTGTLNWTLDANTSDGGSWLSAFPVIGTAPSPVTVSVLKANLPGQGLIAGTFAGELVFRSGTISVTVPVSVVVGANVFRQVNPISFVKPFAGADPLPQTLTAASTGATFQFTASASTATGGNWLTVQNVSFDDCALCLTPQTVRVNVNPSPALAAGTYTGQVVLTARDGSQSITVPVTLTIASASSAFFDNLPGQMSFSFLTSGANPPAQSIQIRNGGTGTLSWSLDTKTADGGAWLGPSLSLGNAPSTITVSLLKQNLPGQGLVAGTFVGELILNSSGSSVTIPVSVIVNTNAFEQVNALNFTMQASGLNPLPQTITIASTGTSIPTNFQFTFDAKSSNGGNWLAVDNVSFNDCALCLTPQTLRVSANPSPTLAAGTYIGQIVVTARDGSEAMTIPVTLTVESSGPFFDDLPGQMSFFMTAGGSNPASHSVGIRNGGSGSLNWTSTTTTSDGGGWLSLAPGLGGATTATVAINSSALPGGGLVAGTFTGEIVLLDSAGSSASIPVAVYVAPNSFVQLDTIAFSRPVAAANPPSQVLNITSAGAAFQVGVIAYTGKGSPWLTVSTPGGCGLCLTPAAISANIVASASLAAGTYTGEIVVTMRDSSEAMTIPVILTIGSPTPAITSIVPGTAQVGGTQPTVAITGLDTHFVQGTTVASFGAGVTVNSLTIHSGTSATASVTVLGNATLGPRNVTLTTGTEVATAINGFTVSGTPSIKSVTPNTGQTGQTLTSVAIVGLNTNFVQGSTLANFGAGITINSLTVNSATSATANITVQSGAGLGAHTVTLTTGTEVASLVSGFTVTATASIQSVTPNTGQQGQTLTSVAIVGQNTNWVQGTTAASFGTGITVNNLTVNSATSATANITVPNNTTLGARTVTLTTGAEVASLVSGFTVTAGPATLVSVTPNMGQQGQTLASVAIVGQNTNFVQGTTVASFGAGVTINGLTVNSGTSATANITVPNNTTLGARTVTLTTGSEVASLGGGFTVTAAALQSIAVTPANPTISKGLTQQFTATGTFSDNSTQNLTGQVTWASATTSVATITSGGLATGVATGTSTISAKLNGVTGSTVLTVTAAALQSIAVTPANPTISKGLTQQFTATGTFSDNSTQNLTGQVTWASATTSVATITSGGLATGVATGTSTISAKLNGVTGSTVLTVTAAALQSIAVTPANPTISKGLTQQFTATGTFSDNSTQNLTGQVTWASATTSVATITSGGLATGVATGTSTISAKLNGVTGSTVLTVTTANLQSIAVTPANPTISKGLTQQFTATGTFSDNSTQNLTGQVTWASATTSVATITSGGLATGVATGTSTISAKLNGVTGSTVLTVTTANLQSIAVTPANPTISKGLTQQFTATGTFSDNSTQNLTGQVTWASATTSVATITSGGLATGVATGTSTISAKLNGVTGSTVLTVTAAALQSIAVTPANPTISKGLTQQFTATGTFSDNSTQNLTGQVTWASATTSVATITSGGLATGVATGTSTISAKLNGVTGSTVLTVTAAALQSIAVTPANPTISKGLTQQFTATGTFSDNSTQNLTGQVTWASATTSVATITSGGLATGVATGTSTISAKLNGVTGSTVLTVTTANLQSIAVTPANPTISKGLTQQFTATGTFSDNSTQNLTGQVTWASATTSVATITSGGLATGVATGTSTISAKLNGVTGSTVLTVKEVVVSFNVLFGSQSFNIIGTTRNRLPWLITGIQVVFPQPMVSGNINSLGGVTATAFTGLGTNTLTWTINPLSLGTFVTTLSGTGPNAIKDASGTPLGDGAGFTQTMKILMGDYNDDGIVSSADLVGINNATVAPYDIFADINGDGIVNVNDVALARTRIGTTLP